MDITKMTAIILAGGKGSRISEESVVRPKPMITIGGKPILWHIMKIYSYYGVKRFIICCGYKGEYIKKYFSNFYLNTCDANFRIKEKNTDLILNKEEVPEWEVILANTGLETLTSGRIKKIEKYIGNDDEFFITYGDGVADIDINELIDFHHKSGKIVTISVTQPEGRFGAIKLSEEGYVENFAEKARRNQSFVNIGFMVANRKIFEYIGDGSEMLEKGPFEKLARENKMAAYKHEGFWSPMDNINDRAYLEKKWETGAPWKMW